MKPNQITLDKTKAYDISELNKEQIKQIAEATEDCSTWYLTMFKEVVLHYYNQGWQMAITADKFIRQIKQVINAKTLFK